MQNILEEKISKLWDGSSKDFSVVDELMQQLDNGKIRVVNKTNDQYVINEYVKKGILLYFRKTDAEIINGSTCTYFDKIPLKTKGWNKQNFIDAGFRLVYGAVIRYSAYIAKSAVIMPSFINVGAFIDEGTMIDTNSLVGSCAQIGRKCHISDGVTIGGVLEPLQANPVIIEDNCFVGVGSSITEGVIIRKGSVIGAGVNITSSTKIINRTNGDISYGNIPPYSVVVNGSYQSDNASIACAVIVKQVDEQTRQKTSINELLR